MKKLDPSKWYDIPGFPDYVINIHGEIKRKYNDRSKTTITPHLRGRHYLVKLTKDGIRLTYALHSLMGLTFIRPLKEDECYYHKNGDSHDNFISNIGICKKKNLIKIFSPSSISRNKAVAEIDDDDNVIRIFKSLTEASKELHLCVSAISERCNGKVKSKPRLVFDDDIIYDDDIARVKSKTGPKKKECES